MKKLGILAIISMLAMLFYCGKDDKGALLLPLVGAATASGEAAPAVPATDLSPVTSTAPGGGTVTEIVGESSNSGSTGSGSSGTGSSGTGSTGNDSSGTGSTDTGSSGTGSTGTGSSGSGSNDDGDSDGQSNTGDHGDSDGQGNTGDHGDSDDHGATSLSMYAKEYTYIEGTWYQDGNAMFTYQKDKPIGFNLSALRSGRYSVTVEARHWVAAGYTEDLPSGFSAFQVVAASGGTAGTMSIAASTSAYNTGTTQVNVTGSGDVLLLSFGNPTCGTPTTAAPSGKALVCHIPPGNPSNAHTLTVGTSAVSAHVAHGDYSGACQICVNLEINKITLTRVGDASGGLSSYLKAGITRNAMVTLGILGLALMGIAGITLYGKKKGFKF